MNPRVLKNPCKSAVQTMFAPLLSIGAFAQLPSPDNRIVVLGEAFVELPADRVVLTVTLAARDSVSVQRAYEKHKRLESSLVRFLKEAALPDSAIRYQLLNVQKETDYEGPGRRGPKLFATSQSVDMTLSNVRQYTDFTIKLIKAGFDEFSSSFTSSRLSSFRGKLLEEAVKAARRKAEVMAKASDRKIDRISKVMDTEEEDPVFSGRISSTLYSVVVDSSEAQAVRNNISDIPQTIRLAIQVKVVFLLQ